MFFNSDLTVTSKPMKPFVFAWVWSLKSFFRTLFCAGGDYCPLVTVFNLRLLLHKNAMSRSDLNEAGPALDQFNNKSILQLSEKPFDVCLWQHSVNRLRSSSSRSFLGVKQNLLEGSSEVSIENSVYDGVQAAVAVSDPEKQVEESVRDGAVLSADSMETVGEKKREPAEDKNTHHHCQNKGEALLPHLSYFVHGQRHLSAADGHRRGEEAVTGEMFRWRPWHGGTRRRWRRF